MILRASGEPKRVYKGKNSAAQIFYMKYLQNLGGDLNSPHFFREERKEREEKRGEERLTAKNHSVNNNI